MSNVNESSPSKDQAVSAYKPYYLLIENLPWLASHDDIRVFFKEVTIPIGCISYSDTSAIVAFSNEEDRNKGLKMNNKSILDSVVHLSALDWSDLVKIRRKNVRRVLCFPKPTNRTLRRIRPTFNPGDISETFSIFNPEETDQVPATADSLVDPTVKRKIKPTSLKDISNFRRSFYDDEVMTLGQHCAKKIKIDDALLLAPICTV